MTTTVYVKMDARDQLLLSEGVCSQLGILHYHPSVRPWCDEDEYQDTMPVKRSDNSQDMPLLCLRFASGC